LNASTTRRTFSRHFHAIQQQQQQEQEPQHIGLYRTKHFDINDSTSTSAKVTSLLPGSLYRIGVAARTGGGSGPESFINTQTQSFSIRE